MATVRSLLLLAAVVAAASAAAQAPMRFGFKPQMMQMMTQTQRPSTAPPTMAPPAPPAAAAPPAAGGILPAVLGAAGSLVGGATPANGTVAADMQEVMMQMAAIMVPRMQSKIQILLGNLGRALSGALFATFRTGFKTPLQAMFVPLDNKDKAVPSPAYAAQDAYPQGYPQGYPGQDGYSGYPPGYAGEELRQEATVEDDQVTDTVQE